MKSHWLPSKLTIYIHRTACKVLFPAWFKVKLVPAHLYSLSRHSLECRKTGKDKPRRAIAPGCCSGWPKNQFIDFRPQGATHSFLKWPPQALRQILFLFCQGDQITFFTWVNTSGLPVESPATQPETGSTGLHGY